MPPTSNKEEEDRFSLSDIKAILPDSFSLILVYISLSFIIPMIPWLLEFTGIRYDQLLTYTAITNILSGIVYAASTFALTKVVIDKTLPLPSVIAAGAIFLLAFVREPYQFIALRISIGAIQAGIPPNLIGGRSGRKGTSMGILNSSRFIGQAIGPFIATSILGDGTSLSVLSVFTTMAGISLLTALFTYLTHTKRIQV